MSRRGWLLDMGPDLSTWIGLALALVIGAVAIIGPWVAPHDPDAQNLTRRLEEPSGEHLLGLDTCSAALRSRVCHLNYAVAFSRSGSPIVPRHSHCEQRADVLPSLRARPAATSRPPQREQGCASGRDQLVKSHLG